jgi:fatty-acyl-CoA synthase
MKSFRSEAEYIIGRRPDFRWLVLPGGATEQAFTLRQLGERIHDYCAYYRTQGVRQGDTVLIILKESLDLFASFFAGIIYGALPAYFAYPSPKQSREAFLASVDNLVAYNHIRLVVGFSEVVDVLRYHEALQQPGFLGVADYTDIPALGAMDFRDIPVPEREAFLQFSSGTTGAKKGVRISAEALFNQIDAYSACVQFDEDSLIVSWLPHYHDMGLIACMLMPFLRQIPVVMMSPFEWVKNPRLLPEAITKYRATHCWQPNFALGHMTKSIPADELQQYDLCSLRQLVLCSEPVLHDTVQKFLGKFVPAGLAPDTLRNCYAMAENTFAMTSTDRAGIPFLEIDQSVFQREHRIVRQQGGRSIASAGKPLENIAIRILDESGKALSENMVGEVTIKSNCMLDCYHNNPAETEKAMSDGWFKTGDLGFIHGGELYITGRKKDMIIVGGENIYPQDIELILNEEAYLIPGRNVVFGIEDERIGTEKIVILAELKEGVVPPDITPLRTRILNTLGISIADIVLLPHRTLRKGTAGKISRYLNKQEYLSGGFATSPEKPAAPARELRDVVLGVMSQTVKPAIDNDTPLMSSGLIDSFGFVDLISALEKAYGVNIPEAMWQVEYFQTLAAIERTLEIIRGNREVAAHEKRDYTQEREASLERLRSRLTVVTGKGPLLERIINKFPFKGSFWFRMLFRMAGIQLGENVQFLGKVKVKLRGRPENIVIGNNVILGDNVDLRNRENGKIILKDRVYLDHNVRLVAAREGMIEVGFGSEIGGNSVINSGGTTRIGEFCMIAGGVNINSSRHGTEKQSYIKEQPHSHGFVELGDDVWIGSGASILINTRIGTGAVVSSNSLASGEIPDFALCVGVPAKVIQYR